MNVYRAGRLWVRIQYFTVSIIWGIIIAFITIKFTAHLEGPFLIPIRILVFILGFSILDIRMETKAPEGILMGKCISCDKEVPEDIEICLSCYRKYLKKERGHR